MKKQYTYSKIENEIVLAFYFFIAKKGISKKDKCKFAGDLRLFSGNPRSDSSVLIKIENFAYVDPTNTNKSNFGAGEATTCSPYWANHMINNEPNHYLTSLFRTFIDTYAQEKQIYECFLTLYKNQTSGIENTKIVTTPTSADFDSFDTSDFEDEIDIVPLMKERNIKSYSRNRNNAMYALKKADFKCEICKDHKTFQNKNGFPYMEIHHLIPMSYQEQFNVNLDVSANMICLCPMCHRRLHYGRIEENYDDLLELIKQRTRELNESNIDIASLDFLKMYE